MIEANEPTEGTVVKQETPATITTTQIIEDLENGITRDGIKEKYSLDDTAPDPNQTVIDIQEVEFEAAHESFEEEDNVNEFNNN